MTRGLGWQSGAVGRFLERLDQSARPGSRVLTRFRGDMVKIVRDDFKDMLMRNVDRYGKPRAAPARSTMEKKRRGGGASLIPQGVSRSKIFTHWDCSVSVVAGRTVLKAGWSGLPWIRAHLDGASKPGTKWRLPRRDVGGMTPKGWRKLHDRFRQVPGELIRFGGGR